MKWSNFSLRYAYLLQFLQLFTFQYHLQKQINFLQILLIYFRNQNIIELTNQS